jgi:HlyD family secretion protein
MAKKLIAVIALIILLVMSISWFWIHRNSPAVPLHSSLNNTVLAVSLSQPFVKEWKDTIMASGSIAPFKEILISAEVNNLKLNKVMANTGEHVHKGQELAHFDDAPLLTELDQAEAGLSEAKAVLTEAKLNAHHAESLKKTGAMSEHDILQYQSKAQIAQAQVNAAYARVKAQHLKRHLSRIMAPDDGIISARNAMEGAVVNAGTELFRLFIGGRLEWHAELSAEQLSRVSVGQSATISLADGSEVKGTVRQIAPTLDNATRTAIVYVDLESANNNSLKAGLYTRGTICLGQHPGLSVPSSSVVVQSERHYVYTVDAQQRAKKLAVRVGQRDAESIEIIQGLHADQQIVLKGASFLNDGDFVQILEHVSATMHSPNTELLSESPPPIYLVTLKLATTLDSLTSKVKQSWLSPVHPNVSPSPIATKKP